MAKWFRTMEEEIDWKLDIQAAALRMQNLDRGMEELDFRLQHSALIVAATIGSLAALFSDFQ